MNKAQRELIQYLLLQYFEGNVTTPERVELARLLNENKDDLIWLEQMEELFAAQPAMENYQEQAWEIIPGEILHRTKKEQQAKIRRIHVLRRVAVAASIILLLGVGSYFLFFNKPIKGKQFTKKGQTNDVSAPALARATLKLSNGTIVYLDSAKSGILAMQDNVNVIKFADGQIGYQSAVGSRQSAVQYNTLTNPRGSKVVALKLEDGTQVWLNAESSLTYPTAFMGKERKVNITGEAYFEVAHNPSMPFKVSKGEMEITVLGTHFNVNTYDDEQDMKVTLLEGSVRVSRQSAVGSWQLAVIKPGEQLQVGSAIRVIKNIDMDEVMAWKNGRFLFNGTDLKTIMRQIMRWYDVEVVYQGNVQERFFTADISRNTNLSELLKVLELSKIHFEINGKRLIVKP